MGARIVEVLEQQLPDLVARPEAEPGDLFRRFANFAKATFTDVVAVSEPSDLIERVANIANAIFAIAILVRDSGDIEGARALLVRSNALDPTTGEARAELARLQG